MRRDTDSAGVEFRVAVAGPLVSLGIVVLCAAVGIGLVGVDAFLAANPFAPQGAPSPLVAVLAYLASINALLLALQPDSRLPARRWPDRPGDRLEAHRRSHPSDPLRGDRSAAGSPTS